MGKLKIDYVSNKIGEEYKDWEPGDVVIIDAQTGTGKNWFVENVLLPWIPNKKLLYISNRTNLKREVKTRLLDKYGMKVPDTLKELDKIHTIKNITISSYHALQYSSLNELYEDGEEFDISRYDYIVLDECHFPLTDPSFNNLCYLTYETLFTKQYSDIVKIFMSATMDDVKDDIIQSAEEANKTVKIYETGRDYSYVKPKYIRHRGYVETLVKMIKNDTSNEKWLIFISNLDQGKEILKELGKNECSIIKAGTKNSPELDSIINENQFNKKVLIATKALDNGINLKDPKLTNIVILAWDKTSLIQMLGRKRIDIKDPQSVNLYISARSKGAFEQLQRKYDANFEDIKLFNENKNRKSFNKKYDNRLKKVKDDIFYKDAVTCEFMLNPIGVKRLNKDYEFANMMIAAFEIDKDFAYVHQQLNWLGLNDTFDEDNFIESDDIILDSDVDSLKEYLNSIVGQVMLEAKDRSELIEKIGLIDTHHSNIKENRIKLLKNIDTLNSYLREIEIKFYIKEFETSRMIDGKKKKFKSAWKVLMSDEN